jgi:hypothetical protein
VARIPNVSVDSLSIQQALLQTYFSKAGSDASDAIEAAAAVPWPAGQVESSSL